MNQAQVQAEAIVKEVTARLDNICRIVADIEPRYRCAADEGAKLAGVVRDFLQDPEAVGTDKLNEAYYRFMQMHAGNFYVAPVVAGL